VYRAVCRKNFISGRRSFYSSLIAQILLPLNRVERAAVLYNDESYGVHTHRRENPKSHSLLISLLTKFVFRVFYVSSVSKSLRLEYEVKLLSTTP
jgi:hypothetical protein